MSAPRIYLDHAATSPLRPEAFEAMLPWLSREFGNASSLHAEGRRARDALEAARGSIHRVLGATEHAVVFTSGATEADSAAVLGVCLESLATRGGAGHVVASSIEHPAVLETLALVESLGGEVSLVPPERDGRVDPSRVDRALRADTRLVSVMAVNNETGVRQDVATIGESARRRGMTFHTDAVQWLGKGESDVSSLAADLISLSAHKVGGPKGIGALLVRRGAAWRPSLRGGGQERGRRAGTENVAGAIGFAAALRALEAERERELVRLERLRDAIRDGLVGRLDGSVVEIGAPERRVATVLAVSFPRLDGESVVRLLDAEGVAVSTGSACNRGARKVSHVLPAMGLPDNVVQGSVRISLGPGNDEASLEEILGAFERVVGRLLHLAPPDGD